MNTLRTLSISLSIAAAMALGACSSAHTASDAAATDSPASTTSASTQPSAADTNAAASETPKSDPYPDWAAAVVPDYPARVDQQSVTPQLYQIDSPDAIATVAAWYKAHTTGGTWTKNDPDSPEEYFYAGQNGVKVDIQANHYAGTFTSTKAIKTMIAFTHHVN